MLPQEQPPENKPLFSFPSFVWWLLIGMIFATGLAVRLYRLADPPVDFHPTRQLHAALIARGMYYEADASAPAWQREMAASQWRMEGRIEPQVFERITAWSYRLAGQPDTRVPRLYAIFFWMVAALFITLLARSFTGPGGALAAALFFLIWPYGVVASRAFQPEPLMIALVAAGLWCAAGWRERAGEPRGGWAWAVAAGLLSGLAIYIKSVAVFFVSPALAAIVLSRGPIHRSLRDPQVWGMAVLAVLPYAAYHVDGVYLRGYLVGQFSQRFFPEMWLDPAFYLRWLSNLRRVVPFELVLVAGLSVFLVRKPWQRMVLLSMGLGYFMYGLTLPHHISTHDYYHLPLFPLLALGIGAAAETVFQNIRGPRWLARLVAVGALLVALMTTGYDARSALKNSGAVEQAQAWQAVGQALGPGASVIALVDDYGTGLKYYAWINPALWPTVADIRWQESAGQEFDFPAYFQSQAASKEYFVIGLLDEFERQAELEELLAAHYPILDQGPGYLIYDLRSPKGGPLSP